jgi:two-component system response regulator CpxR
VADSEAKLLIIDDDLELCELLAQYLTPQGFAVEAVQTGEEGAERVGTGDYRLVVLDVMLPGIDGFEVLRRIRAKSDVPLLMLTARGEDLDRIIGLELGADDYLRKPFNPRELAARIRAILRRSTQRAQEARTHPQRERLVVGDVEMDFGTLEARLRGEPIRLTATEFDLLEVLLRSAGNVVERDVLFRRVLGRDPDPLDRSIDMHVSHLRKKLGRHAGGAERIKASRGVGYVYTIPSVGV